MIGVAGCGRMGGPMLAALRASGLDARGFDIRPPEDFGALTPYMTDDPVTFRKPLTTLISVVRDIAQTDDVLFGVQDFISAPALKRVIICSTLSPRYVISLRDRVPDRIAMVDAPMSGAQVAAEKARLSFMLGGTPEELALCQPLFDVMGTHFHVMGPFGSGMQAKVLNNLLAASNTAMTRLVLDWAQNAGLNEAALLALIETSSGQNWFASGFNEIEFSKDGYSDDNTIGILVKDVESALDAAPDHADTALPRQIQTTIRNLRIKSF